MPIIALCLLRIPPSSTLPNAPHSERLDDALLVNTGRDFGAEPEQLSGAMHALLGEALLALHDDARGLFFLPDVAAPRARTYAGVVEEVGEGGVWGPREVAPPSAASGLEALLGGVLGRDPKLWVAAAAASARDNPGAIAAATAQLQGLLEDPRQLDAQVPGLAEMLRGSGIDFTSPALQQMAAGLQAELERDPQTLARLAEQLFSEHAGEDDEEDEDD